MYLIDNESYNSWKIFDDFTLRSYPEYNLETNSEISDMDKGAIKAHKEVLEELQFFFCSNHRSPNIIKKLGKEVISS